jgi:hypothetical protein
MDPSLPGYSEVHTWGRTDCGWTFLCENGFTAPDANLLAILGSGVIKHTYGSILDLIARCPCFVDYVGTFKDRTEKIGTIILNLAVLIGFIQIATAIKVITSSPFHLEMIGAVASSIMVGIITGWLICWSQYHCYRSMETSCKETALRCGQGVDQDGDGIEMWEVCHSMHKAWMSQKDVQEYDDPDDNDEEREQDMNYDHDSKQSEWEHKHSDSKLILV